MFFNPSVAPTYSVSKFSFNKGRLQYLVNVNRYMISIYPRYVLQYTYNGRINEFFWNDFCN